MGLNCWKCGASLKDVPRPLSRLSRCLSCYSDLYCCRMCRKYAVQYTNKCSDERADPPLNKQNANFCDWFTPDPDAYSGQEKSAEREAKDQLSALFGGTREREGQQPEPGGGSAAQEALREARRLFGDGED